jgi:hypothetical protein
MKWKDVEEGGRGVLWGLTVAEIYTFSAYFPYFGKTEYAYEITLLSVCVSVSPLSLLGNG